MVSPAWVAVIPTFPGVAPLTMVTVFPETVARVVSLLSKMTGNPELDSALTVNGALAGVYPESAERRSPEHHRMLAKQLCTCGS